MRKIIKREPVKDLKITIEGRDDKVILTADKIYYKGGDYDYKIKKQVIKKRRIKRGKFLICLSRRPPEQRHKHGHGV